MHIVKLGIAAFASAVLICGPAQAQNNVDFGNNSSTLANDGECADPRFEGRGMATTLLDEDAYADANDCRALFRNGSIRLRVQYVDFGNNSSTWANDGECDDPRFIGRGMAEVLLDEDAFRDANDCRALYRSGSIRLR